jgi:enoyl-CoA hydratase/carnithine racemase
MKEGFVKLDIENKIATINFYHPKSNSLPTDLLKDLTKKFNMLSEEASVNAVILKSDGENAFCAGASFDELFEINNFEDGKEFFMGFARLINSIRKCSKIVVGRIHGKVVGGGVGLVSVCDYSFATESASLRLSELALGLGPFVVGPPIERKIGKEAFVEMSLDCQWRKADWAKQHGFYHEVFDNLDELDENIDNFSKQLSERSLDALTSLKKIFWEETDHWDALLEERAESSGRLVLSEYTKKFIEEFKSKR